MKSTSDISFIILALSLLKGIGSTFIKKNLATIKDSQSYWVSTSYHHSLTQLLVLLSKKYSFSDIQEAIFKTENILSECEENKIDFTSVIDKKYPNKLFDLKDPPPILFYVGNLSLLNKEVVTIIGTRKPSETGKIIAERVGKYFSSKGWVICNGLANGIDTYSILEKESSCFAKVIGVIGSGLAKTSFHSLPKQSIINIERILSDDGLVISEMPPLKKQDTFSVVKSCRIQAGIGAGLILIQSSINGGSRFTVKAAVESNKPLGIVSPIKKDMQCDDYSANIKIIEEGVKGLHEFADIKNCKFSSSKIVILSDKNSYPEFESVIDNSSQLIAIRA